MEAAERVLRRKAGDFFQKNVKGGLDDMTVLEQLQKAIEEGQDIKSTTFVIEFNSQRMMVKDTDKGKQLVTQIQDLKKLLVAYRTGFIKEKEIF